MQEESLYTTCTARKCNSYGTRAKAYQAVNRHVMGDVRHFLTWWHKVGGRGIDCFPDKDLYGKLGVLRLRSAPPGLSGAQVWTTCRRGSTRGSLLFPAMRRRAAAEVLPEPYRESAS